MQRWGTYQLLELVGVEAHVVVDDEIVRAAGGALAAGVRLQVEVKVAGVADVGVDDEARGVVSRAVGQGEEARLVALADDDEGNGRGVEGELGDGGVALPQVLEGERAAVFDGRELLLLDLDELGFADAVAVEEERAREVLVLGVVG